MNWIETRPVPVDFGGPVDTPFEPFLDSWLDGDLLDRFEAQAELRPDKIAIDDGKVRLTYAQTRRAVHKLTAEIDAVAPPGEVIVAILANAAAFPVVILAAVASGRPLIPIDVTYPGTRKASILQESGLGALILGEGIEIEEGLVPPEAPRIIARLQIDEEVARPSIKTPPDSVGGVGFTSGSTGRPKGIAYLTRTLLAAVAEITNACHINADDRVLSLASLSVGGIQDTLMALSNGATVRVCDIVSSGLAEVLRILREERITVLSFIPLVTRMLMEFDGSQQAFQSLRILNLYGDRTLVSDVELYRSKLPQSCFIRVSLASMETASIFHGFVGKDVISDGVAVAAGFLAGDKSIMLLDEAGEPALPGAEGELVVRGRNIGLGAWQEGRLVQGPFLKDPEDPHRRIYNTGDIVRLRPDGQVQYVGRRDRRIKVRGLRADPTEVEAALLGFPGVSEATVITRPLGDEAVLVAYVAPAPTDTVAAARTLRERLYAEVPEHLVPVEILFLDKIPRLPNFKPNLVELTRHDQEHRSIGLQPTAVISSIKPKNGESLRAEVQAAVEESWKATLGAGAFRADQAWDEAGGDSLKALQLILRIEERLARHISLDVLPRASTPDALTEEILRSLEDSQGAADDRPILFILPGLYGDEPSLAAFRRQLSHQVRCELLDYPDIDRPSAEISNLQLLVSQILQRIEAIYPSGPIYLAGYSLGGVIGLEVARRLAAAGRTPAFFGVLDTFVDRQRRRELHSWFWLQESTRDGPLWFLQSSVIILLINMGQVELVRAFILSLQRRYGRHRAQSFRKMLLDALIRKSLMQLDTSAYPGDVTVFRADDTGGRLLPPDLGWTPFAASVEVFPVKGHHNSLFSTENLPDNAAVFMRALLAATDQDEGMFSTTSRSRAG